MTSSVTLVDATQGIAAGFAKILHAKYKLTGNPLYAWRAYNLCRIEDEPIPDWVLEYLDRAASSFERLCHPCPKKPVAAIAEALEMATSGPSVFARMNKNPLALVDKIMERVEQGEQPTYAIEAVAKDLGVSTRTLWREWQKFTDTVSQT
jgi:hypothetical protein